MTNIKSEKTHKRLKTQLNLNRKHKDDLFRLTFRDKESLLSLYNALHQSTYDNPDELIITTLEDAIYIGMKNDTSFIINWTLNIYEHQSTYNPNMPLRDFLYAARAVQQYIDMYDLNEKIYSEQRVIIPRPHFVVFYNGKKDQAERQIQRLSDSYPKIAGEDFETSLECTVLILNINAGYNKELMNRCKQLEEYAYVVDCIRRHLRTEADRDVAINNAIDECIEHNKLADILKKNRAEVKSMLLTEFDFDKYIQVKYEDGVHFGREEGREEGFSLGKQHKLVELICKKLNNGKFPSAIADELEENLDLIQHICFIAENTTPKYDVESTLTIITKEKQT